MAGRILVLDDEENYAEMLQDLLRENDYRVDMATRPERAIALLEEIPYDLVISDYKMPVMDGADFLKKARELYPNLPFILVSGLMNTPELVKVANMSVTLVMEKPLDTEAFLKNVAQHSEPMTAEEKEQLANEGPEDISESSARSYPEEPRFFSASNFMASRFLQTFWAAAKDGVEAYIMEPVCGDAELALKDVSYWRGNGDMPVDVITMESNLQDAVGQVRGIVSDFEKSRVMGIRLGSVEEIGAAKKLTEAVKREVEGADSVLLGYIVPSVGDVSAFEEAAGQEGAVLPSLNLRPSDVAAYARRFARISADRSGKTRCAEFSPDAVYAILAYSWPQNYKQVQEVIFKVVEASEDEPLSIDLISEALGAAIPQVEPEKRIDALMKTEQRRFLSDEMEHRGLTAADLAKKLELDASIQTKDDLSHMPLIRPEFGNF